MDTLTQSIQGNFPYTPANLSFDRGVNYNGIPVGWSAAGDDYRFVADGTEKVDGEYSARLSAQNTFSKFGASVQCVNAGNYLGNDVQLSGYIKTSNVAQPGYAGLWFRVDGPNGKVLAFDNMDGRGVVGTTPWRRYQINLPVSFSALNICFGALLVGEGTAWFDHFTFSIR